MTPEADFWAEHPAAELLAGVQRGETVTASGLRLTRTYGNCLWPGVREGDVLFYAPLSELPLAHLVGKILIAQAAQGTVAHRLLRALGAPGRERVVLGGDLTGPDAPRRRDELLGVAKALYRPGQGFVELPAPLEVGPLGGALLAKLARFFSWAERVARD